jgi:hypothetical protein
LPHPCHSHLASCPCVTCPPMSRLTAARLAWQLDYPTQLVQCNTRCMNPYWLPLLSATYQLAGLPCTPPPPNDAVCTALSAPRNIAKHFTPHRTSAALPSPTRCLPRHTMPHTEQHQTSSNRKASFSVACWPCCTGIPVTPSPAPRQVCFQPLPTHLLPGLPCTRRMMLSAPP